jgi:paraquat-inducible protein A
MAQTEVQEAPSSAHPELYRFSSILPVWVTTLVGLMLLLSAVLNVIALYPGVPFLEIDTIVLPSLAGPYSILMVIQLLWTHGLYPLVILVIGFSVIFPPVKLTLATVSIMKPMTMAGRERLLSTLGHLGRWSLLDVFVSLLILLVLSKQGFVGVGVHYGLYCFLSAIILNMFAGMILHEMCRRRVPDSRLPNDHVRPLITFAGWQGVVATILALAAIALIFRAFSQPLFQINQFGLVSNAWSLQSGIEFLFTDNLRLFAAIMLFFLVIAPLMVIFLLMVALYVPLPHRWRRRCYLLTRYVAEWSMLDVFSLAMVLYLSEQSNFVPLIIREGTWFLFCSVVVFSVAILWAEFVMRRVIIRREDEAMNGFQKDIVPKLPGGGDV